MVPTITAAMPFYFNSFRMHTSWGGARLNDEIKRFWQKLNDLEAIFPSFISGLSAIRKTSIDRSGSMRSKRPCVSCARRWRGISDSWRNFGTNSLKKGWGRTRWKILATINWLVFFVASCYYRLWLTDPLCQRPCQELVTHKSRIGQIRDPSDLEAGPFWPGSLMQWVVSCEMNPQWKRCDAGKWGGTQH